MLKGRYTAFILSAVIHFAVIALIINQEMALPSDPNKDDNTIKSYIYTPPKKVITPKPQAEFLPNVKNDENKKQEALETTKVDTSQAILIEKVEQETVQKQEPVEETVLENKEIIEEVNQQTVKNTTREKSTIQRKFSAIKQLGNLKNRVNQEILAQEFASQSRTKSPSVMHEAPNNVPHSTQQLTQEQKDKNNTANYSGTVSTTKYDDGNCMVEQDLSSVGIEGVKSQQWFKCGESKFDKGFREHMKKVQAKLAR